MPLNPNLSYLDSDQCIHRSFDVTSDRLRVDAEITASIIGPTEVIITNTDDSIAIGTATQLFTATTIGPNVGLDVNVIGGTISGEFSPSGLRNAGRITTADITDTVVPLPAVALTDRNAMSITNLDTVETLYVGFINTITPDRALGTAAGWEVGPQETFNIDIKDNIILYGVAETGITIRIKIMELS